MAKSTCRRVGVGLAVAGLTVIAMAAPAFPQGPDVTGIETQADTVATPIPIEELPAASIAAAELISEARESLLADSTLLTIADLIPSASIRVDSLCTRSEDMLASQPTLRRLRNLQSDWQGLIKQLDGWQASLSTRIAKIGEDVERLARMKLEWQLTEARAGPDRLPGEAIAQISQTISDIEGAEDSLYRRRNELLLIEYQVAELEVRCRNRTDLASAEAERMRKRLLVADAAPLWSREALSGRASDLDEKVRVALDDHVHSIWNYVKTEPVRVGIHLAIFAVAVMCIVLLGKYASARADGDPTLSGAAEVLRQPVAAALLVAALVDGLVHTHPPGAWSLTLDLIMLVPLLALGARLVRSDFRVAVYIVAGVLIANSAIDVLPPHSFTGRVLKLGIKITLIVTAIWMLRRLYHAPNGKGKATRRLALAALGAVVAVLAVSIGAGLIGNVSLSNMLYEGVTDAVYLGLIAWLGLLVLRSVVSVVMATEAVRRTNLFRRHGEGLRLGILTALNVAVVLAWLIYTLEGFKVLSPVYNGIKQALASTLKIGSLEIATGDIVLFIVIIWVSFLISRFLRAILREEVFPRVKLAHGIPMAVDKLSHYAILLIGFFMALAAAGINLNRFTLLAGALGVGIGFGLQNIVNNLVSGLIVLFERPVQIGDKVKIGTIEGEIKRIGLRATVIRTWEGAEVMVPNSKLILDEVSNWTLSDQQRRIEVQVGVAYGSNTDEVNELLLKVASEHKEVIDYPEPYVLFVGFGESSLNFALRAWVGRFGDFLRVRSELTAAVNKALAEAGITIPFPQRDVHMKRSDEDRQAGSEPTGEDR